MIKTLVVAHDLNNLIGCENKIPWHNKKLYVGIQPSVKKDLQFFRTLTINHTVIMGKNTFLSLSKPLDRRTNIVLSTKQQFDQECDSYRVVTCSSWDEAFKQVKGEKCFIIGGAQIYHQALGSFFADEVFETTFKIRCKEVGGNKVYFPKLTPWAYEIDCLEENDCFKIERVVLSKKLSQSSC